MDGTDQINIQDIFPSQWFLSNEQNNILVRYYTIAGMPPKLTPFLNKLYPDTLVVEGMPIWFRFVNVTKESEIDDFQDITISHEDGNPFIYFYQLKRKLFPSGYCFVATPISSESEAKSRLNIGIGIARAHLGLNTFRQLVNEFQINTTDGSSTATTVAVRSPHPVEGPFFSPIKWKCSEEILQKIKDSSSEKRFLKALEYLNRGISEYDFVSYWIALELICDSYKENEICNQLSRTYNERFKDIKAGGVLGFKKILRMRQDFFHKGITPFLTSEGERYIQLMLIDLLRNQLGLPASIYAKNFVKENNLDLDYNFITIIPQVPQLMEGYDSEEPSLSQYKKMLDEFQSVTREIWPDFKRS